MEACLDLLFCKLFETLNTFFLSQYGYHFDLSSPWRISLGNEWQMNSVNVIYKTQANVGKWLCHFRIDKIALLKLIGL